MLNNKWVVTGIIAAMTAASSQIPQAHAALAPNTAQFQINKKAFVNSTGEHSLAAAPYILNDNTMIPLRALTESLSARISWNETNQTATLTGAAFNKMAIKVNDKYLYTAAGTKITLPERVVKLQGTLFVPLRSIAEAMGAKVQWTQATRTITITGAEADDTSTSTFLYDFNKSDDGWKGDFADLPVTYEPTIYNLDYSRELLPLEDNKTNYGMKLTGTNRSDDLFMFMTKSVQGLAPNTEYNASLSIGMYTNEEGGQFGIGGAPGESVYIKAAVLGTEPKAIEQDEAGEKYYRMNIDKGNQSMEGKDTSILGNITKPDSSQEGYQLVTLQYNVKVTTNQNGEVFLLIGSDSGYEGLTTLYFDDIKLSLKKV